MKKILYLFALVFITISCTSEKTTEMDLDMIQARIRCREMMNEFYENHLRYPRNSKDYCRCFYAHEKLNNFKWARLLSDKPNVTFSSLEDYNEFMDSVYTSQKKLYRDAAPNFTWQVFYKNNSDNDIVCKDGLVRFENHSDGITYYTYDIRTSLRRVLLHEYGYKLYSEGELNDICRALSVRMRSKDSILIDLPETVYDRFKTSRDLSRIADSVLSQGNKKPQNAKFRYMGIRYHRGGKMETVDRSLALPDEIKNYKQLVHYMDSCVNLDKRVDFIQFYYRYYSAE